MERWYEYDADEDVPGTSHIAAIHARWRIEDEVLRRSGQWQIPPSLKRLLKRMGKLALSLFVSRPS